MAGIRLHQKRIILGVTGSIAAYKAVNVLRLLLQEGADVSVVMTESAKRFVTPLTFEVLSKRPVAGDLFSGHQEMKHLTLPQHADLIVLAPCTANRITKCALGLADDLLSTMMLTTQCPVLIAPAMDGEMWEHPAITHHVQVLRNRGITVMEPEIGPLASGKWGLGRMPAESAILSAIQERLNQGKDWIGHRFLISAGPTREPIDAVRFITNGSTGKMGYALAQAAHDRGAEVELVSGPTALEPPRGVDRMSVGTGAEMYEALLSRFDRASVLVMAAAVGDFRPRHVHGKKVKKAEWKGEALELEPTTDILTALSAQRTHQLLVGFAAESENLIENGQEKLRRKNLDMIVVNQIGGSFSAFGNDTNEVTIITRHGDILPIPRQPKGLVAHQVLDELRRLVVTHPSQRLPSPFQA